MWQDETLRLEQLRPFEESGPTRRRDAGIDDYEIEESERRYRWERSGEESS
jgi:nuclear transport factor 2 (NTF2) superfamily protein